MADEPRVKANTYFATKNHGALKKSEVTKSVIKDAAVQRFAALGKTIEVPLIFTPAEVFSGGGAGVWYEAAVGAVQEDQGTLAAAGTGDNVGFQLDQAQGVGFSGGSFTGLGSEIVTGTNSKVFEGGDSFQATNVLTGGKYYRLSFFVASSNGNNIFVRCGSISTNDFQLATPSGQTVEAVMFCEIGAIDGYSLAAGGGNQFVGELTNISIREILGTPAVQTDNAFRAALQEDASGNRYLDYVESEFDRYEVALGGGTSDMLLIIAAEFEAPSDTQFVVLGQSDGATAFAVLAQDGSTNTEITRAAGTPTFTLDGVEQSWANRGDAYSALITGGPVVFEAKNLDLSGAAFDNINLFGLDNNSTFTLNGKVYGYIICETPSDDVIEELRAYMTALYS